MYARNPVPFFLAHGVFYFCEYIYARVSSTLGSSLHHASSREPCGVTFTAGLCEIRTAELSENFVSRSVSSSRVRKVTRVFVQSQSFNPCHSIVYQIRRADFAQKFCFCRIFRENRQANWGFAVTRLEFQLQPRRFRLRRVAENGNHSCASPSHGLTRSRPCQGGS